MGPVDCGFRIHDLAPAGYYQQSLNPRDPGADTPPPTPLPDLASTGAARDAAVGSPCALAPICRADALAGVGPPITPHAAAGVPNCRQRLPDAQLCAGGHPPTCPSQDARQWHPEGAPRTRLFSAQPIDAAFEVDEAKDTLNSAINLPKVGA